MEWQSKLKTVFNLTKQSSSNTSDQGRVYERRAETHLVKQGLKLLLRNYSCKHGEIDLVMRDADTLVFVEVRFRKHSQFGGAVASITPSKQEKVRRSAEHYLVSKRLYEKHPVRFDVVALSEKQCEWIKGAF